MIQLSQHMVHHAGTVEIPTKPKECQQHDYPALATASFSRTPAEDSDEDLPFRLEAHARISAHKIFRKLILAIWTMPSICLGPGTALGKTKYSPQSCDVSGRNLS